MKAKKKARSRGQRIAVIAGLLLLAALLLLSTLVSEQARAPEPTPSPSPTPSPTPVPTPEPTPDLRIGVEGGEYLLSYEETGEYGYEFMEYWVIVPDNAMKDLPLIVFLHGDGWVGMADSLNEVGILTHAREIYGNDLPFILLIPCTNIYSWEDDLVPHTLLQVIDRTVEEYRCNADKVILTGHSRGAIGTWYMIHNYTDRFSCAVPVSCSNDTEIYTERLVHLPVWAFVGDGYNDYYSYGSDMEYLIAGIQKYGGWAQLTILEGMDHGDTEYGAYTQDVFEWMIAQERWHEPEAEDAAAPSEDAAASAQPVSAEWQE